MEFNKMKERLNIMIAIGTTVKLDNKTATIEDFLIPESENDEIKYSLMTEDGDWLGLRTESEFTIVKQLGMKLNYLEKVHKGKYTNVYNLHYKNAIGNEKIYEVMSRRDLSETVLGTHNDAITIIIHHKTEDKYLLLYEYRLSAGQFIFNVVAGLVEKGENAVTACIREVFEETNIEIKETDITYRLPASFSAIGLSDEQMETFFVEVDGEYNLHTDGNPNEIIVPRFYSLDEIEYLLHNEKFTSRTQLLFEMLILQKKGETFWNSI